MNLEIFPTSYILDKGLSTRATSKGFLKGGKIELPVCRVQCLRCSLELVRYSTGRVRAWIQAGKCLVPFDFYVRVPSGSGKQSMVSGDGEGTGHGRPKAQFSRPGVLGSAFLPTVFLGGRFFPLRLQEKQKQHTL